jgi:pyruvate/2-oxoglutarate dehydrogenase complex dihydrolipoamide dehydrogenase (E3) component
LVPEIPGVKEEIVVTAWDVLRGRETGLRVIVVGAGLVGVETALFLSNKGKEVLLIEMLEEIGRDAGPLNRARLREELKERKIEVRCKTELLRIGKTGISVRGEPGEYEIPAETVVLAIGAKSHNRILKAIEGKISEVYSIGDCVSPRKVLEAVQEGYQVGLRI